MVTHWYHTKNEEFRKRSQGGGGADAVYASVIQARSGLTPLKNESMA